jgi:hypothetical protein
VDEAIPAWRQVSGEGARLVPKTMMHAVRAIGILGLVLAVGCAVVKEAPPSAIAQRGLLIIDPSLAGPKQNTAAASAPPRSEAKQEASVALAPPHALSNQPATTGSEAAANEAVAAAPAPPSASRSATKAAQPLAKAPIKDSLSPAIEQPRKNEAPAPAAKMLEPPLDVAALKARLRDTDAIGMFTKLALKNQVDDLLKQFRARYLSGQKTSVASLRQPYDMLVLQVLALVQDSDPSLASTISGSREAIWGILADPEKFSSVS